jgi:putative ABC transport system permease protein
MFKNYIKIATRNLFKQKIFSLINIAGLAIAIAFCILIFLFIRDEVTHDGFHKKADRLYRVNVLIKDEEGRMDTHASSPPPLGPACKEEFPEVVRMARFKKRGDVVLYQGQSSRESIALADPDFFTMFSFPLRKGNAQTVLEDRNSVVLTDTVARRYFGSDDPMGRVISIKLGPRFHDFTVSGVAEDIPQNSSITFDFLVPFDRVRDYTSPNLLNQWTGLTTLTFVELQKETREADLESKFPQFVQKHIDDAIKKYFKGDFSAFRFEIQPLKEIYLDTQTSSSYVAGSNPLYSYILGGIAFLILVIAAINYMNLAIARSASRLREIGVRKVLGADRKKLMAQFFGESLFFSFLSLCLGVALAELFLPSFNHFVNKKLAIGYFSEWTTLISILGMAFLIGLLSGAYPALFLSGFRPVEVLRSRLKIGGKSPFSRGLVIVQFTLSIFLVISTLVMAHQLEYLQKRDMGIQGEQVVIIPTQGNPQGTRLVERFRNELTPFGNIFAVSGACEVMGNEGTYTVSVVRYETTRIVAHYFFFAQDFLKTLELEIVEGRDFGREFTSDPKESIIVNEKLVEEMGWDTAVGKKIRTFMGRKEPLTIVGVVKDFHFESLHTQIKPAVFYIEPRNPLEFIYVKISPDDVAGTLGLLEETWKKNVRNFPFMYSFLDDEFHKMYTREERWQRIIRNTSFFAILISCLGLFGLCALTITRRTKEIGIRKVLGASVPRLTWMVSLDFLKLVIFANIVSWPLAYYAMSRWLRSFAFRIDLTVGVFLLAAMIAAAISLMTVGLQAAKASGTNPVESLRYE